MLIRNAKNSAGKPVEVWLCDGKIAAVGLGLRVPEGETVLDAKGRTVLPAFIDTHCHWRTPGFEYKEDISTGSAAAAAGGYTFVNLMPNTKPVCSSAEIAHAVEAEAAEKIEATALYLRELDAEAKAAKEEADRMLDRVKSMQKRSDYLKAMLLDALHATGKVKTGRVTVSIRTTQAVEVSEGANLPEAYTTVKTTVTPNKVAIKQALLDGVEVPGCSLEARESVSIR